MNSTDNNENDINQDGKIDKKEIALYEQRAWHRRNMAWVALIASILSAISIMFLIPESKLKELDGLLELYWIGLLGITGTYVGVSTWMARR